MKTIRLYTFHFSLLIQSTVFKYLLFFLLFFFLLFPLSLLSRLIDFLRMKRSNMFFNLLQISSRKWKN